MSTTETFKDPRTIVAAVALVAVGTSTVYFQGKISKLEEDVRELQTHLSAIIPHVDPKAKDRMNHIVQAIRVMDSRLSTQPSEKGNINPQTQRPTHKYNRLTKRLKSEISNTQTIPDQNSEDDEYNDDTEDDIKAMMS